MCAAHGINRASRDAVAEIVKVAQECGVSHMVRTAPPHATILNLETGLADALRAAASRAAPPPAGYGTTTRHCDGAPLRPLADILRPIVEKVLRAAGGRGGAPGRPAMDRRVQRQARPGAARLGLAVVPVPLGDRPEVA